MQPEVRGTLLSTRVWSGGELPLMELTSLWTTSHGPVLTGQVTGVQELPFTARYRVECDAAWYTRSVWISLECPPVVRELHIAVSLAQEWTVNGERDTGLDGLFDVDIQVTPSTNTLPIRRLGMASGKRYDVTPAWVQVPSLVIAPLLQQYICVDKHHLRYGAGDFRADLEVDEHGLIERYGNFWRRLK
jgi:uncharacterized protein